MNLISNTRFILTGIHGSEYLKRIKRKLKKQKLIHLFQESTIKRVISNELSKSNDNNNLKAYPVLLQRYEKQQEEIKNNKQKNDYLDCLRQHLLQIKMEKTQYNAGILTEENIITHKLVEIPNVPQNWDVLFLQYNLNKYENGNTNENVVYWCKVNVSDSQYFIINNNSIDTTLEILNKSVDWTNFINMLNNLNCYGITQSFFSERKDQYISFPYDKWNAKTTTEGTKDEILLEYSKSNFNKLKNLYINDLNWEMSITTFDNIMSEKTPGEKYVFLPKISIVCLISDPKKFTHTVFTFLKLDYPMDKLELVVIDDTPLGMDKMLKGLIPNDKRIKFINIKDKNKDNTGVIPLGYKLNIGNKYATHDIIFHFDDTSIYFSENFRNIIKCFLLSNKDLVIGDKILEFDKQTEISLKNDIYNINNMIYFKKYWLANMFQEVNDPNVILYKFMYFRTSTISKLPSVYWSFKLKQMEEKTIYFEKTSVNVNLETLISDNNIKESYNLIWSK